MKTKNGSEVRGGSFTLTCNQCGKTVNLTQDNIKDYYRGFGWGKFEPSTLEHKDKILIWYTEDMANDTISCSCGNEVRVYP
ncbi:hypothetical protein PACILC2_07140 [Paenibacillus cisolokensis]|uniref:Uncharacterized protein n=1 Tax=Paenibacillus cisolokensis TaxID=1658519 RepID=A0ABQ4N2E4_9BACL|nr:hypothetical protein PACILC2_07140 [Paenibacillus cisolokensis]